MERPVPVNTRIRCSDEEEKPYNNWLLIYNKYILVETCIYANENILSCIAIAASLTTFTVTTNNLTD